MLYRGTTPLTGVERLDYEIERELVRMRDEGLVMEGVDSTTGESYWAKTLRGVTAQLQETHSEKPTRITFAILDSSC